jgi:hypothetical protein
MLKAILYIFICVPTGFCGNDCRIGFWYISHRAYRDPAGGVADSNVAEGRGDG